MGDLHPACEIPVVRHSRPEGPTCHGPTALEWSGRGSVLGEAAFTEEMQLARKEFASASSDELATAEAVRELTTSALNT